MSNFPYTDEVVGPARIKSVAVERPGKAQAHWGLGQLGEFRVVLVNLNKNVLLLKIPNDDGRLSASAEPVPVGAEDEAVDGLASAKAVEVLALVEVPEHGNAILATRSAEGTVWGNGDSVNVAGVTNKVSL